MLGVSQKLQSGATSGAGVAAKLNGDVRELTFYIKTSNGTVTTGAIQIETASDPNFAGTWAPLGSPVTLAQNTEKIVQATGSFAYVRANFSANLTGGATCDVYLIGNKEE